MNWLRHSLGNYLAIALRDLLRGKRLARSPVTVALPQGFVPALCTTKLLSPAFACFFRFLFLFLYFTFFFFYCSSTMTAGNKLQCRRCKATGSCHRYKCCSNGSRSSSSKFVACTLLDLFLLL